MKMASRLSVKDGLTRGHKLEEGRRCGVDKM